MSCADRLGASDLAGFLDGDLPRETRLRVEAHLDQCPECWAELLEVQALRGTAPPARTAARGSPGTRWGWYVGLAAAAGLATLVMVTRPPRPGEPARDSVRAPATDGAQTSTALTVVGPAEGAVTSASAAHFTWHSGSAGLYRFTLLTETGEPAWTVETTDTALRLPSYLTLEPGLYFWRVDAIQDGLSASSGIHRLRIER